MKKKLIFSLLAIVIIVRPAFSASASYNPKNNNSTDAQIIHHKVSIKSNTLRFEKEKGLKTKNITFDFPNTDLKVFARFVAKLCRKTLVGEDLLTGNINIKSQKKMDLKQVINVFETVLNSKGLGFTETKVSLEIMPIADSIVKVYDIKYLKSADLAKSLTEIFKMSFRVANKPENIQITSIDTANSLMVLAPKGKQFEIERSIRKLDSRSKQVLLNIMVIEISKESQFGFGTYLNYDNGATNTGLISSGAFNPPSAIQTFTTAGIPSAGGYGVSRGSFTVGVQGVDKNTRIKVLSQPRIMAKENQKANIEIGEKQNYISGNSSLGGNSKITQTTASNDIGLKIEITPRINKIKNVILELKLQITNVQSNYSFNSSDTDSTIIPVVGQRIINNTSSVMDGETLVIAGLLKNEKVVTRNAPPVLGDIPMVGWLFAKESEETEQVELMVFITPTVIDNSAENRVAIKEETNKLRNYDPKVKSTIDQMLTGKKTANDDPFNMFDYFSNGEYRKEQNFIPQPKNL